MNFVGTVSESEGTDIGPGGGEKKIARNASAAMGLNGAI